ncbi:MAG: phosphate propanoyltransferase [Lachnospiraceae bacterium]|nr:phosphate propanoyltransferase [Lachnospiraceae bacterium]
MQEQLVQEIANIVLKQLQGSGAVEAEERIPIGVSARHVHLCREHIDVLFGKGYQLNKKKDLMGGQYAAQECVTLVGTKLRAIENVRILGPERKASQVEVAKTDAIRLGVNPPIRESGKIEGSAPIALVGPKGVLYLEEGCIVAMRHIHMSPEDARRFGVTNGQIVNVRFDGPRGGTFEDVLVRVDASFTLEMHIDTDEANGLDVGKTMGILLK